MTEKAPTTKFAEPYRQPRSEIEAQYRKLKSSPNVGVVLNALPYMTLILNGYRQVLISNDAFLKAVGATEVDTILGQRPGEVFRCIHSDTEPYGCGTAENCRVCGAVRAILRCQETNAMSVEEARISTKANGDTVALDVAVCANPFRFNSHCYLVVTITDISHEKRRKMLERIFFHDIANVATGIMGLSGVMLEEMPEELADDVRTIHAASEQLVGQLETQRALLKAENKELTLHLGKIRSQEMVQQVAGLYKAAGTGERPAVQFSPRSEDVEFTTDGAILSRVLVNMLNNAVEASSAGEIVTIESRKVGDKVRFSIHNNAYLSREVQLQVFQRSFSTKGAGRGLGTYSMKLLTERYLNGRVWFVSSETEGTTFSAEYPLTPKE